MKKNNKLPKVLKILINFLLTLMSLFLFFSIFIYTTNPTNLLNFLYKFLINCVFLFLLIMMRKVTLNVINKNPFSESNIFYFKYTGYSLLLASIIDLIGNMKNFNGFLVLAFEPHFTFHLSFFLYLSFALLGFVLSQVFKQAYEVKKENDLTI